MIFLPSFLSSRGTSRHSDLPPVLSSGPSLPSPHCTRLQMFDIFFCDFTEPKSTKTDSSGCRISAPTLSPSLPRHSVMPPPSSALPPHPVSSPLIFPPLPVLPSPHLCVTVVLIWTLVLQLPRIPTNRVTSPTNTHKQETHLYCTHAWNTHIQYIPRMPVQTHTLGKQV